MSQHPRQLLRNHCFTRQRNQQPEERFTRLLFESLERRLCLAAEIGFASALNADAIYGVADMERDAAGNFYVATDQELNKYSPARTLLWSVPLTSAQFNSVEIDSAGNVYASGIYFGDQIRFGSVTINTNGQQDYFVVKFNSAGQAMWGRSIGGPKTDEVTDLAVDSAGNVYATGTFNQSMNFGSDVLTSVGGTDVFVVKISTNNVPQWGQRLGGVDNDNSIQIDVDANGNAYFIASTTTLSLWRLESPCRRPRDLAAPHTLRS